MKSKQEKIHHFNKIAFERRNWRKKNHYYYQQLESFLSFLIPHQASVLEIGCGTGEVLASLRPSRGLGVDFSENMIGEAKQLLNDTNATNLEFRVSDAEDLDTGETFDYILLSDLIGELNDVWEAFRNLRKVSNKQSKVVITYYNAFWEPILKLGTRFGLKMPQDHQNWLSLDDINNLLELNGFEVVRKGNRFLAPWKIPLISDLVNRFIVKLPLFKKLGLVTYVVAQRRPEQIPVKKTSVTVLVPCRNEHGNIRPIIDRIPMMGSHTEILFVDGNSNDGTVEEIEKVIEEFNGKKDIRLIHQLPLGSTDGQGHGKMLKLGKGDAVRKGFIAAKGDILMILDADMTVKPEELPRFYLSLIEGRADFINGTRLVYPMEKEAMRTLNKLANHIFAIAFSWLLDQHLKDTLCGTKVLFKKDYITIANNRSYFGDFDPFGDFDLLFGAAKANLKIVDMPVYYAERTSGDIKVERFKHGLLLFRMCIFAMIKIKFV